MLAGRSRENSKVQSGSSLCPYHGLTPHNTAPGLPAPEQKGLKGQPRYRRLTKKNHLEEVSEHAGSRYCLRTRRENLLCLFLTAGRHPLKPPNKTIPRSSQQKLQVRSCFCSSIQYSRASGWRRPQEASSFKHEPWLFL